MRVPGTVLCYIFAITAPSVAFAASDVEGCKDLKLFRRVANCVIVECASKLRDIVTVQVDADHTRALEGFVDSVTYSCPVSVNPRQVARDLSAKLHEAAYQLVYQDTQDPMNMGLTARKGGQWFQLNSETVDAATTYSLSAVETGLKKSPKAETCTGPQAPFLEKSCVVVECNSASSDMVAMRTGPQSETSLRGPLLTTTLSCAESTPTQIFDTAQKSLGDANFEILFSDRTKADDSFLTGRSGKRWVQLSNWQEGESMAYVLTVVPSAETVVEPKPRSTEADGGKPAVPGPIAAPVGPPVQPAEAPKQPVVAPPPVRAETAKAPAIPPAPNVALPVATSKPTGQIIPPKAVVEVAMEVSEKLKQSIVGDVFITLDLDVDEKGKVTKAVLAGKITKNVQKLESAALDAVRRWQFEPARQGDRPIPSQTTVKLHFEGEVLRPNIPSIR